MHEKVGSASASTIRLEEKRKDDEQRMDTMAVLGRCNVGVERRNVEAALGGAEL